MASVTISSIVGTQSRRGAAGPGILLVPPFENSSDQGRGVCGATIFWDENKKGTS